MEKPTLLPEIIELHDDLSDYLSEETIDKVFMKHLKLFNDRLRELEKMKELWDNEEKDGDEN